MRHAMRSRSAGAIVLASIEEGKATAGSSALSSRLFALSSGCGVKLYAHAWAPTHVRETDKQGDARIIKMGVG